jgi:hypothetical protein
MSGIRRVSDLGSKGVSNILDGSIQAADLSPTIPLSGFRNVIINGDFRINQRAFTSATTSGFTHDRWIGGVSGDGTTTHSVQNFTLGNSIAGQEPEKYHRIVTSGQTSAGVESFIWQNIENVRTLAGQTAILSFWARSASGTPSVAIEIQQYFGAGGSPSATVSTPIGKIVLSTTWTRYSLTITVPSISGKTIGTDAGHHLRLFMYVSAGSNFNTRTGSLGIQSNTFDFWGVQLEQNLQPTPFEQRPIGVELALCQRYYWRVQGRSDGYARIMCTGSGFGSNSWAGAIPNPFPMRVPATSVDSSGIGYTDNVSFDSTAFTSLGINSNLSSNLVSQISASGATGANANGPGFTLILRGNASAYIGFSAEL